MKIKISLKMLLLSTSVGIFLAPVFLHAEDAAPTPPWVAPVPENADWTVTVSPAVAGPAGAKTSVELKSIHVVKTGTTKHDTLTYSDGSTEEAWYVGKNAFLTDTFNKSNIYMTDFSSYDSTGAGDPVHSLGFTGVGWLNLQSYTGVVSYQSVSCYHYHFHGQSQIEAWIGIKDKMPVAYQINGLLYVYSFSAPPTTPLALPPAYQAVWDKSLLIKKRQEMYLKDLNKH